MKMFRALAFVLVLNFSALAGEIHNPAPPPPPTQTTSTDGEIHNPKLLSEVTLNLLTSVLCLF